MQERFSGYPNRMICLVLYFWISCQIASARIPINSNNLLFTSTSDLANLIHAETSLIAMLNEYIDQEEEKLERLKRFSAKVKQRQHLGPYDSVKNINPINTYLTIKHMGEWPMQEEYIRNSTERGGLLLDKIHQDPMQILGSLLPTHSDLLGATMGLFRLQDTYNLKAQVFSDGLLMKNSTEILSAAECFRLARTSMEDLQDNYHALIWFEEAWRKVNQENPPSINTHSILEFLAKSLRAQGNAERALHIARQLLTLEKDNKLAQELIAELEKDLREIGKDPRKIGTSLSDLPPLVNQRPGDHLRDRDGYESLCRGEGQDQSEWANLYCYYKHTPYSQLAPFQIEVVRIQEPRIVILRNIVTDQENEMLRTLAQIKFYTTPDMLRFRVSKSAWVADYEDKLAESLSKRIEQATGLAVSPAEQLHLSCYGIGGFYEPHHDYFTIEEDVSTNVLPIGNRIATILIYLSTPDIGGSTIFTDLKLTVKPTKNDAAFWFNLHRNGTGNPLTRHAACPVLVGTKWIGNKWVYERGQEWRFPCKLENV